MNPILLLHGALGSSEQLLPLKSQLEESGKEVFSFNFSGHGGRFFADDFNIQQFAAETLQFIQEQNLKQVNVFGYSMGGYVGLWAAYQQPAFFKTIVTLGTKFDWTKSSADVEVKKLDPEKILDKVPAFAESLMRRHSPNDWKKVVKKTADLMLTLGSHPILTDNVLRQIEASVVVCLGDKDDLTSADFSRSVSKTLPHGKFILLENAPHPIEKVDKTLVNKILLGSFT
jgi:pimeloyl-ACP methyl ester carboxylesterase